MHLIDFVIVHLHFFMYVAILVGLYLINKPAQAIEGQRKFYLKINWRMEPINMALELRNTRLMGWVLIAAGILRFGMICFLGS